MKLYTHHLHYFILYVFTNSTISYPCIVSSKYDTGKNGTGKNGIGKNGTNRKLGKNGV